MFAKSLLTAAAVLVQHAIAVTEAVKGTPEGFASTVTGGGKAAPVTPTTNEELVAYLGDAQPRVIILNKTFDFATSEGVVTGEGCAPWGTAPGCQTAINKDNWCGNYQPKAPKLSVTYNKAGLDPIKVASNKSLIGCGAKGVITGRGLRIVNAKNVIIQNIKVANINPQHVWGGDAITLDGTDNIWLDHITTNRVGRQHLVLGKAASGRVTVSNCDFDGRTEYSATCDGFHYWNVYFAGANDQVTFMNNVFHHFSGRAPKVNTNSFVHCLNNLWFETSGHAFEVDEGGYVVAEGNVFKNVSTVIQPGGAGATLAITASNTAQCKSKLHRPCQPNLFINSGHFPSSNASILSKFGSADIPHAMPASSVTCASAGYGKI